MPAERTDAPLDLVVLADFIPARGATVAREEGLERLDRESLDDFLRRASPTLTLALEGGPVSLSFTDFRAFRPERLARQIPRAAALLELRQRCLAAEPASAAELRDALEGIAGPPELKEAVRRALEGAPAAGAASPSTPPPPPAPTLPLAGTGDPMESIFQIVDVPAAGRAAEAPPPTVERALDRLVGDLLGLARAPGAPSRAALRAIADALDRSLAGIVRPVLRDPGFRALEATWLGLRFLVRGMDFRSGVRLHAGVTTRANSPRFLRQVVAPFVADARSEGRTACVICDFGFGGSREDLALAGELAQEAEAAQVPVVAGADAALFALDALEGIDRLPDLTEVLADADHRDWQALRVQSASRWLALALNRFLLRSPYGAESDRIKEFAFEENPPDQEPGFPWGAAPWAVGALVASSFQRTGWGVDIVGAGDGGEIRDLPVRPMRLKTGEIVQAPLEAMLSEPRVLQLSRAGILALACRRNSDVAFVVSAPAVHQPAAETGPAATAEARRASLCFALMAAQAGAVLAHLLAWVDPASPPGEIAATLAKGLEFLTETPEGPVLEVTVEPAAPRTAGGSAPSALRISPRRPPLRGLPDLVFEVPLRPAGPEA